MDDRNQLVKPIRDFLNKAQQSVNHTEYSSNLNKIIRAKIGHLTLTEQMIQLIQALFSRFLLMDAHSINLQLDAIKCDDKFSVFECNLKLKVIIVQDTSTNFRRSTTIVNSNFIPVSSCLRVIELDTGNANLLLMDYILSWLNHEVDTAKEKEKVTVAAGRLLDLLFFEKLEGENELLIAYKRHMVEFIMLHLPKEALDEWLKMTNEYAMKENILFYFCKLSPTFKKTAIDVMSKWPPENLISLWRTSRFTNMYMGRVDNIQFHELILPLTPKKFQLDVYADALES